MEEDSVGGIEKPDSALPLSKTKRSHSCDSASPSECGNYAPEKAPTLCGEAWRSRVHGRPLFIPAFNPAKVEGLGTHSFIHSFKQQIFTKLLLRFRLCAWSLQGRRGERGGCRAPDLLELLLGNTSVSVPAAPHLNSGYTGTHLPPAVTMLGLEERVSSACF